MARLDPHQLFSFCPDTLFRMAVQLDTRPVFGIWCWFIVPPLSLGLCRDRSDYFVPQNTVAPPQKPHLLVTVVACHVRCWTCWWWGLPFSTLLVMVLSTAIAQAAGFFTDGDLDVLFVGGGCSPPQVAWKELDDAADPKVPQANLSSLLKSSAVIAGAKQWRVLRRSRWW